MGNAFKVFIFDILSFLFFNRLSFGRRLNRISDHEEERLFSVTISLAVDVEKLVGTFNALNCDFLGELAPEKLFLGAI